MATWAASVAERLRKDKASILAEWQRRIGDMPESDSEAEQPAAEPWGELRAALADLLDGVAYAVHPGAPAWAHARVAKNAREHASVRLRRELTPIGIVREFVVLREAILEHLQRVLPEPPPLTVTHQLHRVLDTAQLDAVRHFEHERSRAAQQVWRRQQIILDALPVGVWFADPHGTITWGNAAGKHIWGGAKPELAQYDVRSARWPDGRCIQENEWALTRALRSGKATLDEEIEVRAKDGSRKRVRNWVLPLRDALGGVSGAVAMNEDISLRAEIDRARERFIAILGHDLRNPLAAISVATVVLRRSLTGGRKELELLDSIARSASRMRHIIDDLLDMVRARATGTLTLRPQACDLAELARGALEEVERAHPERTLAWRGPQSLRGRWDPERVRQAMVNLLDNAIRHGCDPVISWAHIDHTEAVYGVTNAGPQIPDAQLQHLFEPFRQGPDGGLGLGLYIVKAVVTAHGGSVFVDSSDGTTTLGFRVPLCPRNNA